MTRPGPSDAARRIVDEYALHRLADPIGNLGKWFTVRLSDGTSPDNHTLYDSKSAAVRHMKHDERYYVYVQIIPHTMTGREAETLLATWRRLYDRGIHLMDRDHSGGGREFIKRVNAEDQRRQIQALFTRH